MLKGEGFDWFSWVSHSTHSEILLIACADQLLYNLSLIKLCSACAVKNTSNACSLLAK